MNQEITNKTKCLLTREGIEIWINDIQAEKISQLILTAKENKLIEVDGETISVNSISGIYSAQKIEDLRRKKQGQWQCEYCKRWHQKGEQCGCGGGRILLKSILLISIYFFLIATFYALLYIIFTLSLSY